MTDILKFFVEPESSRVAATVRKRPELLKQTRNMLLEKFQELGTTRHTLIAFGRPLP